MARMVALASPTPPVRKPGYAQTVLNVSFDEITATSAALGSTTMILDKFAPAVLPHYLAVRSVIERFAAPVFDLLLRFWIGLVFFRSGLEKSMDWDATVFLFQEEYKLPLLPPEVAAALGMTTEITMPLLLFAGLAARLAAVPLIGMTCVIQFILGARDPSFDSMDHFYWLFLLGVIVVRGAGKLSVDHLIALRYGDKGKDSPYLT